MFIKMVWKISQIVELCSTKIAYKSVSSRSVVTRATILVDITGLGLPRPGPFLSYGVCRIGLLLLIVCRSDTIFADVIVYKGLDQSLTASLAICCLIQCFISHKVSVRSGFWFALNWRPIVILCFFRVNILIRNCGKLRCCYWELSELILHSSKACDILTITLS